jgi:hypothetical protein
MIETVYLALIPPTWLSVALVLLGAGVAGLGLSQLVTERREQRASARARERIADFRPELVGSEEAVSSDPA